MSVSDEKVRSSARAMKESGLIDHGWSYINIDDGCEDTHVDGTIPICSSLDGWEFYQIWAKEMEDGNTAIGIFNLTESPRNQEVNLDELGDGGYYEIRDLWTQRDLGKVERFFQIRVEPHGARMILLKKAGKIFS